MDSTATKPPRALAGLSIMLAFAMLTGCAESFHD